MVSDSAVTATPAAGTTVVPVAPPSSVSVAVQVLPTGAGSNSDDRHNARAGVQVDHRVDQGASSWSESVAGWRGWAWQLLGAICRLCSVSTRQIGSTPNRCLYAST